MPSETTAAIMRPSEREQQQQQQQQVDQVELQRQRVGSIAPGKTMDQMAEALERSGEQIDHCQHKTTNQRMTCDGNAAGQRLLAPHSAQQQTRRLVLWLAACCLSMVSFEAAQAAMNLPDGIENILGFVPRSSFQCERDGYFGDIDNDCRLFHLCQRQVGAGGRVEWRHWTYACGNQTMFNQLTLTCAFVDEAIPCRHASQFQYLNEVIHKPAEPFLTDADVTSGFSYYSNRIMSDGARQRAFEDSQLLAQVGGGGGSFSGLSSQPPKSSPTANLAPQHHHQSAATSTRFSSFAGSQFLSNDNNLAFQHWPALNTNNQFAASVQRPQHQQQQQQQQQQQAAPSHDLANQMVDLVDDRHFHFQHQPSGLTSHSGGAFSTETNSNHVSDLQAANDGVAIASASSNERQSLFAAPSATSSPHNNPPQNTQFEYSITTNHQANSPSEPANVIFRQQQAQVNFGTQVPSVTSAPISTSTTTTTTTTTTAATTTTQSNRQNQQLGSTTQTPPLVPTFTSSHRLQPQTQVTTLVAPSTSTTTSTPPPARRQTSQAPTSSNRPLRAGFQSSRLSSVNNQQQQQQQHKRQAQPKATPIVMRKPTRPTESTSSTAAASSRPLAAASSAALEIAKPLPWSTSGDFWRQSFDSQLMAPKFESLLLRRRV